MMEILGRIAPDLAHFEENLGHFCTSEVGDHKPIDKHIFASGGKRIRPIVFFLCSKLMGFDDPVRQEVAVAFEYIHTASLLHDDVIDNSDTRRGKPTINKLWNNKTAILTGDRIHAIASRLLTRTANLRLIDRVARCIQLMSESEILQDQILWKAQTREEEYFEVLRGKTAALFEVVAMAAPLLAGASEDVVQAFARFGENLGYAFQIADDCLDYEGKTSTVGKPLLADFAEGKITLPLIIAKKQSPLLAETVQKITMGSTCTAADLAHVAALVASTKGAQQARKRAHIFAQQACDSLKQALSDPQEREIFETLLSVPQFAVERQQ